MSTSRFLSASLFFSLLTFASCSTVQVSYEVPGEANHTGPLLSLEAGAAVDSNARAVLVAATVVTGSSLVADNESGELLDFDALPYRKKATGGSSTSLALLLGARTRDSDDWGTLDDQSAVGVEFAFKPKYFPIGVEVGLLYGFSSDTIGTVEVDSATTELYFGPRFEWSIPEGTLIFYVGGGASLMLSDVEQVIVSSKQSFDDTTIGAYLHGGLELMLGKTFSIGFDLRGVYSGDATLNGVDLNPSYYQGALRLGVHF